MDTIKSQLRPRASHGIWLASLVPLCYTTNIFRHASAKLEFQYKVSAIIACSLFAETMLLFLDAGILKPTLPTKTDNSIGKRIFYWITSRTLICSLTSLAIWLLLAQSFHFSLLTGFATIHIYELLYRHTLRSLPGSFTFGEASIVVQGFVLLLLNTFLTLCDYARHPATTSMQQMTVIVQLTLFGSAVIVGAVKRIRPLRGIAFYALCAIVGGIVMAFPIDGTADGIKGTAIWTLAWFIVGDADRLFAVAMAVGLLAVTAGGVAWFSMMSSPSSPLSSGVNEDDAAVVGRASTRTRKYFHVLIVLVFVPGLLQQCTLLFVASGLLMAVFVLLETARVIRLWPLHEALQTAVGAFLDAQDAGLVALTPIYLLAGCAMPLWLHPCGCDLADWAGSDALMPMMAGVLSVGIGDAAASVFGSLYGRHKWEVDGIKSIEGSICSVLAQAIVVPLFVFMGVFRPSTIQLATFAVAIVTNSIVEAKTDQIDNLVLPLVTYIILSLA